MNKDLNAKIMEEIQKKYDNCIQKYGEKHIIGVYGVGPAYYDFAESIEEVRILVLYIPTLKEILFTPPIYSSSICDIRFFAPPFCYDTSIVLELLDTPYAIENPLYKDILFELKQQKEDFAKFWAYRCVTDKIIQKEILKDIEQYKSFEDSQLAFDICRKHIMLQLCQKDPFENYLKPQQSYYAYYLWQIKKGKCKPDLPQIERDIKAATAPRFAKNAFQKTEDLLNNTILLLVETSLQIGEKPKAEDFIASLTVTEKKAFQHILEKLPNKEGVISISQLITETNISRPVFKNLLEKIKKIGTVTNLGVKGTYIKMI